MLLRKKCFLLCVLLILVVDVSAESEEPKSSLVFAIDDTGSMTNDIEGVKKCVSDIFHIVTTSKNTFIKDFILVTFNDPGISHKITTSDEYSFKRALADIDVDGGGDCPENSMSGIELALQKSRPGSLLYVFTDASPKDHKKHTDVIRLAHSKSIKVVFVLTGKCGDGQDEKYNKVATATGGQVFNLDSKFDVPIVLEYVKTQVKSLQSTVAIKEFSAGTHELKLNVDSAMKELVFSISGRDPSLTVRDPSGRVTPTTVAASTRTFTIQKITEVKPGTYTAEVTSSSQNSVVVTADTEVHFRHGFSTWIPGTSHETVTRPIPGQNSYVSITLKTGEKSNVVLDAVELWDLDDKVLVEKPLKLINEKEQFYSTDETMVPPDHLFRVAIRGHDTKTSEIITRISLTPIEPQAILGGIANKKPTVTLTGSDKINAEYDERLLLKCKVSGYPKPKVIWQRSDGTSLDSTLSLIEHPYEYLSTLTIDKVTSNDTYYCVARNTYGGDSKQIQVETVRKTYFNVIKTPGDATIEYSKKAVFECVVDAYPTAEINWYKDLRLVKESDNMELLPNQLVIKRMTPNDAGKYICRAKNEFETKLFFFDVNIAGVESPLIEKTVGEIPVKVGSTVEIPCKVIRGQPKPTINWFYTGSDGIEHNMGKPDQERITIDYSSRHWIDYRTVRCEARNDIGYDYHRVKFILEYPPTIKDQEASVKVARVGEKVKLDCEVDGHPKPEVKWLLNGAELAMTLRHSLEYRTNGINFHAVQEDAGVYTCRATNKLGTVTKTIDLRINKAPTVETPGDTAPEMRVGDDLELPCRADGFPKPRLEWVFYSHDPSVKPRHLGSSETLSLRRLQLEDDGFYNCIARNDAGTISLTYQVKVYAPPSIENTNPSKTFTAVIGDLVLRLPCKATGNPKPTIEWLQDGIGKVAAGTEWYDIDEYGTLLIKNVDKMSAGEYVCEARNELGVDSESYTVEVEAYPAPERPSKTVKIQEGKTEILQCNIPTAHNLTDSFRWFKDGREVSMSRQYFIINAQPSSAGIYTCRVSNFDKSTSGSQLVVVGSGPSFITVEDERISYEEGLTAFMDCTATGEPRPEVTWWHKGDQLPVTSMVYEVDMNVSNRGKYHCVVKNEFGTITRNFEITSQECLLDIQTELAGSPPLLLSSLHDWAELEVIDGNIKIPRSEHITLSCPRGFKNIRKVEVVASCENDVFNVDGNDYRLSELQCDEQIKPVAKNTLENCLSTNPDSTKIKIGYYDARGIFLEVYEICFDQAKKAPIYSKHGIHYTLANVDPKDKNWHKNSLIDYNDDEMYDCGLQIDSISSVIRSWFHKDDGCCFSKRLLVNPRDVSPGLPQAATYNALNVVPHWSTCNSKNWDSVERRVRALGRSTNTRLNVWTGVADQLQIAGEDISVYDRSSGGQAVPKYLWKVVQDPTSDASLAIVQLNIPDLTLAEARRHLLCPDICREVGWMRSSEWRDVTKGYTFCCRVPEFERAYGYRGVFGKASKVLYDVSIVAAHSLT